MNNFMPWDDLLIKEYTKEQMISFAERCMKKLLLTYPEIYIPSNEDGKIDEYDLQRIKQILKQK